VSAHETVARKLRDVDIDTAPLDALYALDTDSLLDRQPTDRAPLTELQRWRLAHHEAGHAAVALHLGCTDIEARIRDGGTGVTRCSKINGAAQAVTFHLAGVIAEARYDPASLHRYHSKSSDFVQARILIDEINQRAEWPVMTCRRAAEAAFDFVRDHWQQISRLALALESCGALDDRDVRVFAGSAA
jgi:hypothetical protein